MVSARYVFAGDGNLVKSIVNGVTTYYVGGIYELEDDGGAETARKHYSARGPIEISGESTFKREPGSIKTSKKNVDWRGARFGP